MRQEQHDYAPLWEKAFVEGLKKERIAQGMTQSELAEQMSDLGYRFDQATVYKIENGRRKVTAAEAWGLAEVFDVTLESLYDWNAAHVSPEATRRLIRTQADRFLQELLSLDEIALRARATHQALVATVSRARREGLTEHRTINDPEVPIEEYYWPLLAQSMHNEILARLRSEVWTDRDGFRDLAGYISGIVALAPMGRYDLSGAPQITREAGGPAFEITHDKKGFRFVLRSSDNVVVAMSESYSTKEAAIAGVDSVRTNAMLAKVEDRTDG